MNKASEFPIQLPIMRFASIVFFSVTFCLAGCSTKLDHIGTSESGLKVGQEYVLKRDAILLGNRGQMDSLANPKFTMENFKPYKDYDPYWTGPRGVVPAGTVIAVREICSFSNKRFRIIGEIMSGEHKRQPLDTYNVFKGSTIGPWPSDGRLLMNDLCGEGFDAAEAGRNLSEKGK